MFVFLDESGNFKGGEGEYFVVGGFVTGDPRRTAKAFRRWQYEKFPRKIRAKTEVKFTDTGLNDQLRLKTLAYFARQDIRILYSYLHTKNIPSEFRKGGSLETGHLYAEIVAQTLDVLFPVADNEFIVTLDHRQLKSMSQAEFRETTLLHLRLKFSPKAVVYVNTIDSATNANIQIADWICGALYRHYMQGINGDKFYEILLANIVRSKEIFEDYWGKMHISD